MADILDLLSTPEQLASGLTPPGTGSNFWDVLTAGINSAGGILKTRYGVPQLNPGQYIQTGPYGSTMIQQPIGGGGFSIPSMSMGGSSSLLLIGGAALLLVIMMAKR